MRDPRVETLVRRIILALLLSGLVLLSFSVLQYFLVPVVWAVIIAYATWPMYQRLPRFLHRFPSLAALFMTLLLTTAFVVPTLWLVMLLKTELGAATGLLVAQLKEGAWALPEPVRGLPGVGPSLQAALDDATRDPDAFKTQLTEWLGQGTEQIFALIGDIGRNAAKLGFAVLTLFFLYRDGEALYVQVHRVLHGFLGARLNAYVDTIGSMTRAVLWGLVLTALAQGAVAGVGYWWAGVPAPLFLSAITALASMIPFGTPFAWGGAAAWLLANGQIMAGVGLIAWGTLVVSWVDNLVRPMVISSATQIPFLLVLFGVLGGLASFGLVGLFVGPVILAVLVAVWREWSEASAQEAVTMASRVVPDEPPETHPSPKTL